MLTVKSTINIAGQTVPQIIPVVQGDTGRAILFTLADFTIPQGSTATYYVQKPSGEAVYNVATIDGNTVLVELTAQSIIEHGDNYGQVRIENDGEIVTSFDFILLVKPFRGIDATQSTTEMNIFDKAVEQAEEAIDEAKDAALEEIAEAGSGNIAEEFDAANSYLAGEYTIYNAKLYRFTSNHTGAWSGSDAEEVTVGDELTDVKDGIKAINISWEYGSINRDTGAATVSSERIRTNSFTTTYKYLVARAGVAERVIIEIYKYNTDGSYVDYTYLLAKDGYLLAYEFDTSHKYIIVSRSVSVRFGFTAAVDDEIYLSLGAIQSDGSFQPYSTNTTIFKPISVTAPKILIANIPGVKTTLFIYDNGTYSGSLRYQDDGNTVAYFPIIPGKTYRLYAETENIESCSVKIVDDAERQLYIGSIYNGTVIASSGNKRTNLINAANHHYVHVVSTVTIYADKYKNGVYTGRSTVYAGVYSPAALDISDCDAFYLLANGVADISYWFDESLVLYDKKWCSYGDSITEQQRWQNYLVAKYHLVLQNKGLGGSCVTGDTSSSVTPMTADSRINTINTDSDIITVMGGTNDFDYCQHMGTVEDLQTSYDTSTFIGSVATIVKKLQARCPNARIILMSNVNSRGTTGQNRDNQQVSPYGYTPYDFAVAMRRAAEWLSVGFVDVWACGINQLNRSKYIEDTVHPNAAGGKLIAQKVMEYFDKINIVS